MTIKSLKFRIYPNKQQEILINKTFGCRRFIYNYFLADSNKRYQEKEEFKNYYKMSSSLTELKKQEGIEWLKEVDSISLQESIQDLNTAFKNFFNHTTSRPVFKSKHNNNESYRTRNVNENIRFEGHFIRLPKLGLICCKNIRKFNGHILNATISKVPSGKYFVSLCVEMEKPVKHNLGCVIGLDVGLKVFYADSNGNTVINPRYFKKSEKKLAREQRRFSKKEIGSHNREKQRIIVARVHEKIANQRKDFLHKLSTELVKENQIISIEDLAVKNLIKNHKLAKSISDASWSEFFRQLEYKAPMYESKIIRIGRFEATTQTCSTCGQKRPEKITLTVREWVCPNCGANHDRDVNAAINILNLGLAQL